MAEREKELEELRNEHDDINLADRDMLEDWCEKAKKLKLNCCPFCGDNESYFEYRIDEVEENKFVDFWRIYCPFCTLWVEAGTFFELYKYWQQAGYTKTPFDVEELKKWLGEDHVNRDEFDSDLENEYAQGFEDALYNVKKKIKELEDG